MNPMASSQVIEVRLYSYILNLFPVIFSIFFRIEEYRKNWWFQMQIRSFRQSMRRNRSGCWRSLHIPRQSGTLDWSLEMRRCHDCNTRRMNCLLASILWIRLLHRLVLRVTLLSWELQFSFSCKLHA